MSVSIALVLKNDEYDRFCSQNATDYEDGYCELVNALDSWEGSQMLGIEHCATSMYSISGSLDNIKGETIYYQFSDKVLIFYAFKEIQIIGTAYSSKEELIEEFRNDLRDLFPEDFDWRGHIGLLSYVT